jgi:hypothetical protein
MPDIVNPQIDNVGVAWFPNQNYLLKQLAAMIMAETEDSRADKFLADAEKILMKFLDLADDKEGYSRTIKLSRERFKSAQNQNPNKAFPLG